MLQKHRFRVLSPEVESRSPLELARHIVAACAEGPVTFRATLKTPRRDQVSRLAPLLEPQTTSVGTFSRLAGPEHVPLDDPHPGSVQAFIEQPGAEPGLLQQWITHYVAAGDGGSVTTLHLRIDRGDPLSRPIVLERLSACRAVGVLPRDADIEAAVQEALANVAPDRSCRVVLGGGSLLAQSFVEGSPVVLLSLELLPAVTASLLRANLWRPGAAVELRRYSTVSAALRAPAVSTYEVHTEADGPLTEALLAERGPSESLTVEWEIGGDSELAGVCLVEDTGDGRVELGVESRAHVEVEVACSVDWEWGPDPEEAVQPFALRAGLALVHLGG